jgi:hypothetical protein
LRGEVTAEKTTRKRCLRDKATDFIDNKRHSGFGFGNKATFPGRWQERPLPGGMTAEKTPAQKMLRSKATDLLITNDIPGSVSGTNLPFGGSLGKGHQSDSRSKQGARWTKPGKLLSTPSVGARQDQGARRNASGQFAHNKASQVEQNQLLSDR